MKKKFLSFISVLFLFSLLFTAVAPLSCFATVDPKPSKEFVKWKLSKDEKTLTDGTNTYTRYHLPLGVYLDSQSEYVYENTVLLAGEQMSLTSNGQGGSVVWSVYDHTILFVADKAREALDEFIQNDKGIFRLSVWEDGREATLSEATILGLNALTENTGKTVTVQSLASALVYTLYLYDASDTFCKEYGGIYELGGRLYYLNYRTLPNNHFDSEGNFSYRSGSVTVYSLDKKLTETVKTAGNKAKYREYELIWENEESLWQYTDSFPIAYAFWGFILPVAFAGLGAVLPTVKKRTKCWGVLTLLGILWILFAIVLLALLI